jgi:hypothetical protein
MDGSMHNEQTTIVSRAIGSSLYRFVTSSLWILIAVLRSLLFVGCAAFQLAFSPPSRWIALVVFLLEDSRYCLQAVNAVLPQAAAQRAPLSSSISLIDARTQPVELRGVL